MAKSESNNKKLLFIILAVVLVIAIAVGIVFIASGNSKVPGKKNDDEINKTPESIVLIQDGDPVKKEDVTAITGATDINGEVTDSKGIKDKNGHMIYSTGQTDSTGQTIYTTGKVNSKGDILYTKNNVDSFGNLIYYTGKYDANGKLILTVTADKPDYTTNDRPSYVKPQSTTTTATVPFEGEEEVKIDDAKRESISYFGGSGLDMFNSVAPCKDGGYVASAYSRSFDGDLEGTDKNWAGHGAIVKYDSQGNEIWKYVAGGDSEVSFNDVTELKDGTIIAVGYTLCAEEGPIKNSKDHSAIIVRLKKNGTVMWTYVFPGDKNSSGEFISCVDSTPDGGFVVGGKAISTSGFFKSDKEGIKAFLIKFDKNCNIKWRRVLTGTMSNEFSAVSVNESGDIFATCETVSTDGDFAGLTYYSALTKNTVLVKLDKNGDLEWKKYLESTGNSEYNTVCATDDGGCVVGGSFTVKKKADGIYSRTYGASDGYVIRYNAKGDVHWARIVGGTQNDYINSITQINGGFVVVGQTKSANLDFQGEQPGGEEDGFVMYLNDKGYTTVKMLLDGQNADSATGVCTLADGTVAVCGWTKSNKSFFIKSNAGNQNMAFVCKFSPQMK